MGSGGEGESGTTQEQIVTALREVRCKCLPMMAGSGLLEWMSLRVGGDEKCMHQR